MYDPFSSLKDSGCAILHLDKSPKVILRKFGTKRIPVFSNDASMISEQVYGKKTILVMNVAMLGAFVSVTSIICPDSILETLDLFSSEEGLEKAMKWAQMTFEKMEGFQIG
jgi:Pyruvate/2-oxoacid:ferredoxin oxidoreductase gamma subunit